MISPYTSTSKEWLEADGLGGFASGTASGIRTRRYHSLLLVATTPPTGRVVLVNGLDAWVETPAGKFSLSSQCYSPRVVGGDGTEHIEAFGWEPWPHWIFKLEDGTRIEQEILVAKGAPMTCISWKVLGPQRGANLFVRPFISGRDYHSLHKANPEFRFDPDIKPNQVSWAPYTGVPGIVALANGKYSHQPVWYYNFRYEEEQARGLDFEEDLAAPGVFKWDLAKGRAALIFTTKDYAAANSSGEQLPLELLNQVRASEQERRESFSSRLEAAADTYIVERGRRVAVFSRSSPVLSEPSNTSAGAAAVDSRAPGKTIIAGYPWFTDWGRDTFIALRGLCLATGRLDDARDILLAWSDAVSEGMLPNRFPDRGEQPEFNAVDASLWFVVAAFEYLQAARQTRQERRDEAALWRAIESIINGYAQGTRYGIRMDDDGLLSCGQPGVQLTWMDAKVGDWVVTPRIGKPVEIQALWLNALWIANHFTSCWEHGLTQGVRSFRERFWNDRLGFLNDVVDVNHQEGTIDAALRPNQILAVGGLPMALIEGDAARLVVERVERELLTPLGLRSLAQTEPGYAPRYCGGVGQRDSAYHLGTVWPWLLGPFVEAWVRVRGGTNEVKHIARKRFLSPLLQHLEEAGLGHVSEIGDANEPHTPRGCPFQAWSVGEALRLDRIVLAQTIIQRSAKGRAKQRRDLVPA